MKWSQEAKVGVFSFIGILLFSVIIICLLYTSKVSSEELAAWIAQKTIMGTSHFYFIIGGPYGNGKNIQARADLKLSMGPMTFTHQMARLILFEQLYRAVKINHHEPYHL